MGTLWYNLVIQDAKKCQKKQESAQNTRFCQKYCNMAYLRLMCAQIETTIDQEQNRTLWVPSDTIW